MKDLLLMLLTIDRSEESADQFHPSFKEFIDVNKRRPINFIDIVVNDFKIENPDQSVQNTRVFC